MRRVIGLVLGYTIYYVSGRPDVQERLRLELLSAAPTARYGRTDCVTEGSHLDGSLPHPGVLDQLPYLGAILKESLRMRPNSTPLPRITPSDRVVTLAGVYSIPPSTRVNTFQWSMHRDPAKWVNADVWEPERFLQGNVQSTAGKGEHAENVLWPFASGSRMCVGNHLAGYRKSKNSHRCQA